MKYLISERKVLWKTNCETRVFSMMHVYLNLEQKRILIKPYFKLQELIFQLDKLLVKIRKPEMSVYPCHFSNIIVTKKYFDKSY